MERLNPQHTPQDAHRAREVLERHVEEVGLLPLGVTKLVEGVGQVDARRGVRVGPGREASRMKGGVEARGHGGRHEPERQSVCAGELCGSRQGMAHKIIQALACHRRVEPLFNFALLTEVVDARLRWLSTGLLPQGDNAEVATSGVFPTDRNLNMADIDNTNL